MRLFCKICGAPSSLLGSIEGYRAGTFFDVIGCSICGTNFILSTGPDEKIYEAIYKNVAVVLGYARYLHYARQVLKEKNPLQYLMNCEDCYWGIASTILAEIRGRRSENLIWEVGCGQGYLTYALVKAGFNAIGLDISETAVASARHRYGNFFYCEEAKTFFMKTKERPSFIILSEVIEHLLDPVSFISELMAYLQPGGAIIVTTPNKAASRPGFIWDTELPPVHLWWFTAKGLVALGEKLSCKVEFANLDEFYRKSMRFRKITDDDLYKRVPILDKEYRVINPANYEPSGISSILKSNIKRVLPHIKRVLPQNVLRKMHLKMAVLYGLEECTASQPITLCAVYSALPVQVLRSNLDENI